MSNKREFQFYIVPTPIGNLKDITLRAIEVLQNVDIIACEDSRVTQKLLNHYEIKTKCISYHKYNEKERVDYILNIINEGKKVALVSDAGTPMICDPGSVLLKELTDRNITVTALAGACAVPTFLSQIPRDSEEFTFIGFVDKTEQKITETFKNNQNIVFYDSPNRILKTLKTVQKIKPNCKVSIGRELTKMFEEVITDSIEKIIEHLNAKNEIKGEFVCMIHKTQEKNYGDIDKQIEQLREKGFSDKDISVILSTLYDINRKEIYQKTLASPKKI